MRILHDRRKTDFWKYSSYLLHVDILDWLLERGHDLNFEQLSLPDLNNLLATFYAEVKYVFAFSKTLLQTKNRKSTEEI